MTVKFRRKRKTPPMTRRGFTALEGHYSNRGQDMFAALTTQGVRAPVTPLSRPLTSIVKEGRLLVTPDLAQRLLDETNYEGQRKLHPSHVELLAGHMRRRTFRPGSQIAFVRTGDVLTLVNGQHRLHAVIESGVPAEFQVLIETGENVADVAAAYYHFDRGGRQRSDADVLSAVGVADRFGLLKSTARSTYHAVPLILNRFDRKSANSSPELRNDDVRLAAARDWWPVARQYQDFMEAAPSHVRHKTLNNAQILAVGLVTTKYQPAKAEEFWRGLAEDNGLRRGDPRKSLLNDMVSRDYTRRGADGCVATANAWNAFFLDRPLKLLKVYEGSVARILGTPFDGRRA